MRVIGLILRQGPSHGDIREEGGAEEEVVEGVEEAVKFLIAALVLVTVLWVW